MFSGQNAPLSTPPFVKDDLIYQFNVLVLNLEDKLNMLDPHEIGHAMLIKDEIAEHKAAIAALGGR